VIGDVEMAALHVIFKLTIATLLLAASLGASAYAADIIQRSRYNETQTNTHLVRSSYVTEECELLEITYREPRQIEIVRVCYPPIF